MAPRGITTSRTGLENEKRKLRREELITQLTGGSLANLLRTGNDAPSTYSIEKSLSGRTVDVRQVLLICCKYYEEAVWPRQLFPYRSDSLPGIAIRIVAGPVSLGKS